MHPAPPVPVFEATGLKCPILLRIGRGPMMDIIVKSSSMMGFLTRIWSLSIISSLGLRTEVLSVWHLILQSQIPRIDSLQHCIVMRPSFRPIMGRRPLSRQASTYIAALATSFDELTWVVSCVITWFRRISDNSSGIKV